MTTTGKYAPTEGSSLARIILSIIFSRHMPWAECIKPEDYRKLISSRIGCYCLLPVSVQCVNLLQEHVAVNVYININIFLLTIGHLKDVSYLVVARSSDIKDDQLDKQKANVSDRQELQTQVARINNRIPLPLIEDNVLIISLLTLFVW